jgi:hypothetical protein
MNRLSAALAIVALFAIPSVASAQVKVVKQPAVIERKTFDPNNRPADAPPVRGNEEAVAAAKFEIVTQPGFTPGTTKQDKENGQWTANIRTQQVGLVLKLTVTLWLPEGASEKAKAHVEGHRQIVEDIYKTADKAALKIGQAYVGRGGKATAENVKAAQTSALKALMQSLAEEYTAATEKRADRAQDLYDELTGQGTKSEPAEADAIKQAFELLTKEEAEAKKLEKSVKK